MEAAKPTQNTPEISKKDEIINDLKKEYKQILINYLDEREFKDEKIKLWVNNILNEAKNYFTRKYMDYDLFLFCLVSEKGVY